MTCGKFYLHPEVVLPPEAFTCGHHMNVYLRPFYSVFTTQIYLLIKRWVNVSNNVFYQAYSYNKLF